MINYSSKKIVADDAVVRKVGMLQAQILTQLDYWLDHTSNIKNGFKWVYNSMQDWHEQFHWVSLSTLKRAFYELEAKGLLVVGKFNKFNFDKTKWYRIDYDALDKLMTGDTKKADNVKIVAVFEKPANDPLVQNKPTSSSKLTNSDKVKMNQPIPEITKNTTKINKSKPITQSNKRYYERYKKHVEIGTDWSKKKATAVNIDINKMQNFFADLEVKTFGSQLQKA